MTFLKQPGTFTVCGFRSSDKTHFLKWFYLIDSESIYFVFLLPPNLSSEQPRVATRQCVRGCSLLRLSLFCVLTNVSPFWAHSVFLCCPNDLFPRKKCSVYLNQFKIGHTWLNVYHLKAKWETSDHLEVSYWGDVSNNQPSQLILCCLFVNFVVFKQRESTVRCWLAKWRSQTSHLMSEQFHCPVHFTEFYVSLV